MANRLQATGTYTDNSTSTSVAFGSNVTAGSVITVVASAVNPTTTLGTPSCSKASGTATIDTPTLDKSQTFNVSYYQGVWIWSAVVTGGGSLTMQVTGGPSGTYWCIGVAEFSGLDTSASRAEATNSGTGTGTSVSSGDVTTAGAGAIVGGTTWFQTTNSAITEDGAFSLIYEMEDGSTHDTFSSISRVVSSGTTDAATWTLATSTTGYGAIVVAYKISTVERNPVAMGFVLQ